MKPSKLKLSIVIVTWNTALITKKCIKTIYKYLTCKDYEIIVADNGSTDNTQKELSEFKSITYFNTGSNFGFAKGSNLAAAKSTGDYILFLNSDMELIDDSLLKMLEFINHHPKIGAIGPQFLNIDLSLQSSTYHPQTIFNAIKQYWLNIPEAFSKYFPPTDKPSKVWSISGGAFLIPRQLYLEIGGWDERYFMFYEEYELCRQIRNRGYDVYFYPLCKVIHRHGASGTKLADSSNQWRRLVPSSITYHGLIGHYIIYFIIKSSQVIQKLFHLHDKNQY